MNIYDKVIIEIKVSYGVIKVTFTIIDILPNYHYALISQNRVVVGQLKVDNTWILSESIDLLNMRPIGNVYHKQIEP